MTPLRQRTLDAMTVRGLAPRTQECYSKAYYVLPTPPLPVKKRGGDC